MIKKILIANRGEIAIRIAKTVNKMGMKVVGIYSKQDEQANHLNYCDETYFLGEDPLKGSYLNQKKILEIASYSNSDAIHPGYGFLSENAKFAKLLSNNSKIFIGPPASAIKLMGDKITSKKIANKAGVNCIPGINEVITNSTKALQAAKKIGYPIMIKASAGGGGKGMRVANNEKELISHLSSAKNEARNAFGDDRVFLEKYIENPRHIEIQILGDKHNNYLWLGDRECSIQRRHQKIIEEAPSSFLDEETRKEMGNQSIMLAKEVGYYSAGTVEYVVNKNKEFFFLEMNTRLQVEHPVTEETTGIDLVEQMINIANNKKLKLKQEKIQVKGWSFESRLCAESPTKNFMPSAGKIKSFKIPRTNIRVEAGYQEGEEVSIFYDPLLAKIISKGKTREEAAKYMVKTLEKTYIDGIDTNIDFLIDIFNNKNFLSGNIDTNFISNNYIKGYTGKLKEGSKNLIVSLLAFAHKLYYLIEINKNPASISKVFFVDTEKKIIKIEIISIIENIFTLKVNKKDIKMKVHREEDVPIYEIVIAEKKYIGTVKNNVDALKVYYQGSIADVKVFKLTVFKNLKKIPINQIKKKDKKLTSPMPGKVVKILVKEGQKVKQGEILLILDAMKMENTITSIEEGIVKKIMVKNNDAVIADQDLIILK